MLAPGDATLAYAVQVPSGTGVSPRRTSIATLVPAGVVALHDSVPHDTAPPASNTRETNVPGETYGVIRIQSTTTVPPPANRSLAAGRIGPETARVEVCTSTPST